VENHVIGDWDWKEIEMHVFESQSPIIGCSVAENQLQLKDPYIMIYITQLYLIRQPYN